MQERYKECPNPTCKAHLEHWEFFDNEEFCSVCGERLRTAGVSGPVPANTDAYQAAAEGRAYLDSNLEARNTNNTVPAILVGILILVILLLFAFLIAPRFFTSSNNTNTVASNGNLPSEQATQTFDAGVRATQTARVENGVITNTNLPPAAETPSGNSSNPGPFPTSTPAVGLAVEPTPVRIDQSSAYLVHNVGMVASCTNSAAKQNYAPNESFYLMVQADFSRTQVHEIHTVWYGPPVYNTVFDASNGSMSIDATQPSARLRDGGLYYVCFQAAPQQAGQTWLVGNYRVVVYINGNVAVTSRDFTVVGP